MVSENQVETLSCFPKQFPNMVPENKTLRCMLKFKVTTKGIWNVSEDNPLESTDVQKNRVSVDGSKHSEASEAKVLRKPSIPLKSAKRRQGTSLDSQNWKKQKMDPSEDKSHEGSVVQRDGVSISGNKCSEANFSVKLSMPVNSAKPRPETSLSQRSKKKMDYNLKLECSKILKELMNHSFGWVFSEPVDPVKLKIPDYFQIIKSPMDLGTIKHKLEGNMYSIAKEFADDVKLTFENAKLYNGPSHQVHHWADILHATFNKRWKLLEARLKLMNKNDEGVNFRHYSGNNGQNTKPALENNNQAMKPVGLTKAPIHDKFGTSTPISLEKKRKSRPELVQVKPGKTALSGCSSLGKTAEKGHCDQSASPSGNYRRSVDSTEAKCSSCLIGRCHCLSSVASETSDSKLVSQESIIDVSFSSFENNSVHKSVPNLVDMWDFCFNYKDSEVKCTSASHVNSSGVHSEEISSPTTYSASFEGWSIDAQMSPRKALRAAMLKSRFADTILKATQPGLLDHGDKSNLSKMQLERQRLEKEQLKEKARIEAQIKAIEAASRRREQDDLKMRRERERLTLAKMEQTVEMDNKASLPGGTGYPDSNILLRIGLRLRDESPL